MTAEPLCGSDSSPDDWFANPGTPQARRAQAICLACPLYWRCQEYAITEGIPYGIFGGMTDRQRRRIWHRQGGRPTNFDKAIHDNFTPLLIQRRLSEGAA